MYSATCFCKCAGGRRIIAGLTALFSLLFAFVKPYMPPVEAPQMDEPVIEEGVTFTMIANGQSDYVIVHGAACSPSEITAASTLQDYLERISGVKLPVVTDETAPAEHEIIVGKTNREGSSYTVDRATLGDEGVYLKTVGDKLVLSGGETRGTLYAVYTFLENYLGCRWFTKDITVVPESDSVKVPQDLDYSYVPPFEYRETDWLSPMNTNYSVANRLNSTIYRGLNASVGGGIGYTSSLAHTLTTNFVNRNKYFESNPELYAIHDGVRTGSQLCLTNPKVLEIVIEEVQAMLNSHPDAKIISLTQWDDQKYCECEKCAALDEAHGSHQGTNLTFVNAVADHFKDSYPNLQFDTFAYQYTRTPPENLIPASNVIVRLCSIECCFVHPLDDPDCEQNAAFAADIKRWSELTDKLYVWDYTTNYANYNGMFPNMHVLQDNMKFFVNNSVIGIYEEGNYTASQANGEFAELRAYLLAKLLWNPNADVETLTRQFCKAYYGAAAQYIMEYLDIISFRAANHTSIKFEEFGNLTHVGIYANMNKDCMSFLTNGDIKYLDELWSSAKSAELSASQLKAVRLSEISWRYWKMCNRVCEFTKCQSKDAQLEAAQQLYDDMVELGITRVSEGDYKAMLSTEPDLTRNPNEWTAKTPETVVK